MTFQLKTLLIIPLLSVVGANVAIAEENVYVLRGSDIACIQAHPDSYGAIGSKKRLLAISLCPDVSTDPGISVLRNEGPAVTTIETPFDSAIFGGKVEIQCLISLQGIDTDKLYSINFGSCSSELKL